MRNPFFHNLLLLAAGLFLAWLVGLVIFVGSVETMTEVPSAKAPSADAIVVLTGGSERIAAGIDLLRAGKGKQLFISGVHPGLTFEKLYAKAEGQPLSKELRARIAMGQAADTIENATETRLWMEANHYTSMILVTSNYHMARSLLELRAVMPGTAIHPYPVAPEKVKLADWWQRRGTALLLIAEYDKYLASRLRLHLGAS